MGYMKISELKRIAKGRMLGNYNVAISAFVLLELIIFGITSITDYVVDINSVSGKVIYYVIIIIVNLIAAVLVTGEMSIYLKIACGKKVTVSDLFAAFKQHPDKIIIIQVIIMLRMLAVCLPMIAGGVFFIIEGIESKAALSVFIISTLISLVGSIYIKAATSQCLYLVLDFPQYTARKILNSSSLIMKGKMLKYIGLELSFVPLMLLSVFSLGIGILFIYPYYQMALTEFYLDIIREPVQKTSTFSVAV